MSRIVSVVVPYYREKRITSCLEALRNQTLDHSLYEVIVVNNEPSRPVLLASDDGLITVLEAHKPGSYSARNVGVNAAKGDVVAFTDSDCVPREDWLECALKEIRDSSADVLCGKVDIFREPDSSWLAWKYDSVVAFKHSKRKKVSGVTANLIVRRCSFEVIGDFDEGYFSGGDSRWISKAVDSGLSVLKSSTTVFHPARNSFNEILDRNRRVAGARTLKSIKEGRLLLYFLSLLTPPASSILQWLNAGEKKIDIVIVFPFRWYVKLVMAVELIRVFFFKGDPYR